VTVAAVLALAAFLVLLTVADLLPTVAEQRAGVVAPR
jgi:hypothetical protein